MRFLRRWWTRIRNFTTGQQNDERLREEMEQHIALQTEENLRAGMSAAEARREAVMKFGGVGTVREDYHAEQSLPFFENLIQDLRYALRMFAKSPGFGRAGAHRGRSAWCGRYGRGHPDSGVEGSAAFGNFSVCCAADFRVGKPDGCIAAIADAV
jgi:hypothetical protein